LPCVLGSQHKANHGPLVALAINFSGNRQTFSNRLKFSILKPAATVSATGSDSEPKKYVKKSTG
jgi:hypothetical protein